MNTKISKVQLNGINLYGFHGVTSEEQQVGSWFQVDLDLDIDISFNALNENDLNGTVDYSKVLDVVTKEFATTSKLLENLAFRTARQLFTCFKTIKQVHIRIQKLTPPMPVNVNSSSVEFVFTP